MSPDAKERLSAMVETSDGFEIAERDLRLRGAGDFFGTRQAGVPTFRLIDLERDRELLDLAQREADAWFEAAAPTPAAVAELLRSWSSRFKLIEVG
jgi:ATP-dependent DNA helicase RecG